MNSNDIHLSADFTRTPVSIDTELAQLGSEEAILEAKLAQVRNRQAHLGQIFQARGGWTRAFLVNNTNGHVHSSTHCSSCFITTQFQWRVELSGSDQAEIITAAGELACTVCYPDAPVAVTSQPGTIRTDAMVAREERAAKAAEAAKAKNAKAIFTPEGGPLKGSFGTIKTEVTARNEAVSAMVDIIDWTIRDRADLVARYTEIAQRIVAALAAKQDRTVAEVVTELAAKAAKKQVANAKEFNKSHLSNEFGKAEVITNGVEIVTSAL